MLQKGYGVDENSKKKKVFVSQQSGLSRYTGLTEKNAICKNNYSLNFDVKGYLIFLVLARFSVLHQIIYTHKRK